METDIHKEIFVLLKGGYRMYQDLLRDFAELKYSNNNKERETLFDICGYPHYENVVSNVLAYFFDPSKPHGLGNVCIQALLTSFDSKIEDIDELWEIEREVRTSEGKFIDILLKNDDVVILIENKVYAALYNDLKGYLRFIQKEYPGKTIFPIVLCLHSPVEESRVDGYNIITYENYFNQFRNLIGSVIDKVDLRYMQIMTDLMTNMNKLKEGTKMDEQFINFVTEHNDELIKLVQEIKTYRDTLRKKVKEVNSQLPEEVNGIKLKLWEHRDLNQLFDIAVIDIVFENAVKLAIDSVIDHQGWRFEIFQRGSALGFNVAEFCKEKGIIGDLKDGRYRVTQTFPFNENLENVVEEIKNLLDVITE